MSLESFNIRNIENRPGKFYVDEQCLDCDLCRETAPTVFSRWDREGYSYVMKQPETPEEIEQARESMEGCCTGAIHDDGDEFDWSRGLPIGGPGSVAPARHKVCCERPSVTLDEADSLLDRIRRWFKD